MWVNQAIGLSSKEETIDLSYAASAKRGRVPSIRRGRLLHWLEQHSGTPIRLLVAPAGFGKTTLLLDYAGDRDRVLCADATMDVATLIERISTLCGISPAPKTALSLLQRMTAVNAVTIFIDDAHMLAEPVMDALYTLFAGIPEQVSFVVTSRNKNVVRQPRWIMEGVIEALWTANLSFDEAELRELAKTYGVEWIEGGIAALAHATEGWPVVASAILRFAATNQTSLEQALVEWFGHYGEALRETILDAAETDDDRKLLQEMITSGDASWQRLRLLEERGLFVYSRSGTPTMLRAAERALLGNAIVTMPDSALNVVQATVLGAFSASIGGVTIDWIRRRDAQVFKYLLLQSGHRATREELMRAFWPTYDGAQASQSLRTTLSNIRTAIRTSLKLGDEVPYVATEENVVALKAAAFQTDLDEFLHCVLRARESYATGHIESALQHAAAARRIYGGPFVVDATDHFYDTISRSVESSLRELHGILSKVEGPAEATG